MHVCKLCVCMHVYGLCVSDTESTYGLGIGHGSITLWGRLSRGHLIQGHVMTDHAPEAVDESREGHCTRGITVSIHLRACPCEIK